MASPVMDLTAVRTLGRNQQRVYWNWALATVGPEISEGHTDTQQLTLPIQPFYLGVIDIGDTFRQIIALTKGSDSDEEGQLKPTQYALNRVASLLIEACAAFHVKFPKARVSPDLDGGLRIEWRSEKGVARIVIPPNSTDKEYLFSRMNGQSKTEFTLTGALIASWLQKVM